MRSLRRADLGHAATRRRRARHPLILLVLALAVIVSPHPAGAAGSRNSQGDAILRADVARATFGLSGAGVRVGIISDGIAGLDQAKASGDLPPNACGSQVAGVTVIDSALCRGIGTSVTGGPEGTAMMEIVADLAPGAELLFCAPGTSIDTAACIDFLLQANVAVIVDDLLFLAEPYFEDGLIADAATAAVAAGAVYVSAAGNQARGHYQSGYVDSGDGMGSHLFAAGRNWFTATGNVIVSLQWSNPFGGSGDNYDLCRRTETPTQCAASNAAQVGAGDPVELRFLSCPGGCDLQIRRRSGSARTLQLFVFDGTLSAADQVAAGSVFGHAAAAAVLAIGAISAGDPGNDTLESFSSRGPTSILFPTADVRRKPDLAAIDGVSVTGAAGFPQTFFGTSAAAPHAAAVAALLLQAKPSLTPADVRAALEQSAVEVAGAAPNNDAGFGRIDAFAAVQRVAPPTPSSVGATAQSSTRILFTWTDGAGETEYRVEYRQGTSGSFLQAGVTGPNATTLLFTDLTPSTTYSFRVRACTAFVCSLTSATAVATTDAADPAPPAPTGLAASAQSSTSILLSWTDVTGETEYRVEYRTAAGAFVQAGVTGANGNSLLFTGLTPSTTYQFRVRACNASGCSAYSSEMSGTTTGASAAPAAPATPTGLNAAAQSSTSILLSWTDVTNETEYRVEYRTTAGAFLQAGVTGPNGNSLLFTGLTPSTAYLFRVRACNAAGCSAYSSEVSATTTGAAAGPTAPATPTGLNAAAQSSTSILLSWTDVTNETEYRVEYRTTAGAFLQAGVTGPNGNSLLFTGLTPSTTYQFRVRACNTAGCSAYSSEVSGTTSAASAGPAAPATPTGLNAAAQSSTSILLSWTDVTGETEYRVEYRTSAGAFLQAGVTGPNGNSLLFTGLTPSTAYQFRVRACNTAGCSAYSSEASGTTSAASAGPAAPATPTGLNAAAQSSTSILLSWTDVTGESEYRVEYRTTVGAFLQAGVTGADGNSLLFTGLAPSTAYEFRVRACNVAGCSAYSSEVAATTGGSGGGSGVPPIPTGLSTTVRSSSSILLGWTDVSGETEYRVEYRSAAGPFLQAGVTGVDGNSLLFTGLAPSSAYQFRVRACNGAGCSPYSAEVSATTSSAGASFTPAAARAPSP